VEEIDVLVPEDSTVDDLSPFIAMEYIKEETHRSCINKGTQKLSESVRWTPS